jgi:hypothetical protein
MTREDIYLLAKNKKYKKNSWPPQPSINNFCYAPLEKGLFAKYSTYSKHVPTTQTAF